MGSLVEDVARDALNSGADPFERSTFMPGVAAVVAVDVVDDVAAVLVVRLRRDGAWIIDVVRFASIDGTWIDVGSAGATYGDLPIDFDPTEEPSIAVLATGTSEADERHCASAGGFVTGPVDEIELATDVGTRRVSTGPSRPAFVVVAAVAKTNADSSATLDDLACPDVRAFCDGTLVDDSAEWRRERDSALDGTVTVAEALAATPGTVMTIRGILLVLDGHDPVICDAIDTEITPPGPLGQAIVLPGPAGPPSWSPKSPAVISTDTILIEGSVRDGRLYPEPAEPHA